MATPANQVLIQAIKNKNWAQANEAFSGIMQHKVADQLSTVKKTIFKEDTQALTEAKYQCMECDTMNASSSKCRKCGGSDLELA
jgi:ribosomal protein L40E